MEPNENHPSLRGIPTKYVIGLLFNPDKIKVALVRKQRPDWQRGKLNAIGGKIETNETPMEAMIREFHEETGVQIKEWKSFLNLQGSGFELHCFWSTTSDHYLSMCRAQTMGGEDIEVHHVDCLHLQHRITNLDWMIHMAISMPKEQAAGFICQEIYGK